MSLEQAMLANTSALEAHSALLTKLLEHGGFLFTSAEQPVKEEPAAKKSETKKSPPASDTSPVSEKKPDAPVESTQPEIDYETVKAAVLEVSKKSRATPQESREQAEALLQRFGVQKISQLGAAAYADVHAYAQRVMGGLDATASEHDAEGLE